MHKKSKRPRYLFLYALVVLACIGLAAAISRNRARRLEIERAHPQPPEAAEPVKKVSASELDTTIGTQRMSLRVDAAVELEDPLDPPKTLLLSARPERPPVQIIPSDPRVFVEEARKNIDSAPETNATPVLEAQGEKILTDE